MVTEIGIFFFCVYVCVSVFGTCFEGEIDLLTNKMKHNSKENNICKTLLDFIFFKTKNLELFDRKLCSCVVCCV